jgi:hypothetical protein
MKILVACEMSGTVRDAFIAKGHDAISCDLMLCAKPGPHYWGSVLDILYNDWDMIIAHPPCTYLSIAGSAHLYGPRMVSREANFKKAVEFFKLFVDHPCKRKCIENPVILRRAIDLIGMEPTQYVHPYMFGEPYLKKTGLWLFGLPKLVPVNEVLPTAYWVPSAKKTEAKYDTTVANKSNKISRSITFKGIAGAMAAQWG